MQKVMVLRKEMSENMGRRPAVFIAFHFRSWINKKRPAKPTHHKMESIERKLDYLYKIDLDVSYKIIERRRNRRNSINSGR